MSDQQGFTLIELMIVIAIVAILSAIGLPAYQNYLQKAALTDMLQSAMPLKTAVEICAVEQGETSNCSDGNAGISPATSSRYIASSQVASGVITLSGQDNLKGLTVTLTPDWNAQQGIMRWQRVCNTSASSLKSACESVFRFDDQSER
ncbi:prepilin peptidase dependent protein D [Izhakiella capsodis]|uniref:Prepilin peptidase dependent protein D n=1 Tax=Izhakiella capsodis TaxID=1367852 RepID=A0A1I4WWI3_9GAMM|nr:prepilin peptidase-dependent pilin [Izhakiella capsodis]SFN17480.1 prepilin peptidase dependent protein D [Izhakiella capsodis]